jgi:hypothetical protein
MINQCLEFMASSPIGEQCVAVLVTGSAPNACDTNTTNLVNIVAAGHAYGVTTFAVGLPGSNTSMLNQIAQAGGTSAALDASGGTATIANALRNIATTVSLTTSIVVPTHGVVQSVVPCEWTIPPSSGFDPTRVNLEYSPPGGPPQLLTYVPSSTACAAANAWYYDNPSTPTRVLACPTACTRLMSSQQGSLKFVFGCPTHLPP